MGSSIFSGHEPNARLPPERRSPRGGHRSTARVEELDLLVSALRGTLVAALVAAGRTEQRYFAVTLSVKVSIPASCCYSFVHEFSAISADSNNHACRYAIAMHTSICQKKSYIYTYIKVNPFCSKESVFGHVHVAILSNQTVPR
jgi:hypothetical protein